MRVFVDIRFGERWRSEDDPKERGIRLCLTIRGEERDETIGEDKEKRKKRKRKRKKGRKRKKSFDRSESLVSWRENETRAVEGRVHNKYIYIYI